jgi:pilus assembly protein Flp/PilA
MTTKLYSKLMSKWTQLRNKNGQTLVEYGLILMLLSIAVLAAMTMLGSQITSFFGRVTATLGAATGTGGS